MYCIIGLPRSGSIAVYSWLLESLSLKYPEYKQVYDLIINNIHVKPLLYIAEVFEEYTRCSKKLGMYSELFRGVKLYESYNNLEQTLIPDNYYYDLRLYEIISKLRPLPLVSLKVMKNPDIVREFINNSNYKTIMLTRKNLKQQFLSYIVASYNHTYHGNSVSILDMRKNIKNIEVNSAMFTTWFEYMTKLHLFKNNVDHTFIFEDFYDNPNMLLKSLNLPELENYEKHVQKIQDYNLIKYIKNPDVFENLWNEYITTYEQMI